MGPRPVVRLAGRLDARPVRPGGRGVARRPTRNDHVLVVVELAGGNDGLNTVVPFEDALYYRNRRRSACPRRRSSSSPIASACTRGWARWPSCSRRGELAVVQGVGYPGPDRSHFRSMEIWHTASVEPPRPTGRLARPMPRRHRARRRPTASRAGWR